MSGADCVVTATFVAQMIVVDTDPITIDEGAADSVAFVLGARPSSTVTVLVESSDDGALTVEPSSFVLGPADYNRPRTVTLRSVQDADAAAESGQVTFTSTRAPSMSFDFTVVDDDRQSIIVDPPAITIAERSATTISVSLAAEPIASATVTIAARGGITVEPTTLLFVRGDYTVPKTVAVRSEGDVDLEDHRGAITLSLPEAEAVEVQVNVRDVDVQALVLSTTSATIAEGAMQSLMLRLGAQPTGTATVTLVASDPAVGVDPDTVHFDAVNWAMPRSVELTAAQDADARDARVSVLVSTPGAATATVGVWIEDDDRWSLSVSAANGGTVTSIPTGIDCGATCAAAFDDGVQVELIANPSFGYAFAGWTGDCSGVNTSCAITMNDDRAVFASFELVDPLDCGAADLCETGEQAVNGSNPAPGDDLSAGGWSTLPGSNASRAYSDTAARSGALSMRLAGSNGAGVRAPLPRAASEVTAEVWYRAETAGGDEFRIVGPKGNVRIITENACGSTAPFMFGFEDPTGRAGELLPISNAPPLVLGAWYRFRIEIAGREVLVNVSDGQATAQARLTLDTHAEFDAVELTVGPCSGDAITFWDDLAVVLEPSLVAHWSYDNGVATDVPDDAQDHAGTLTGNATYEAGRFGRALRFDGGTEVEVSYAVGLRGTDGLTISTWLEVDQLVAGDRVVISGHCADGNDNDPYQLRVDASGNVDFTLEGPAGPSTIEAALPDTEWHHVAAVWDSSGGSDNQRLYLDGEQISATTFAEPLDVLDHELRLGADSTGCGSAATSERFVGTLDETKFFSRPLDASEVAFEAAPQGRWKPMSVVGAPTARYRHREVWTGREYLIWGGLPETDTGSRYDPREDRWARTSTVGAPAPRGFHVATWTDRELMVWGGCAACRGSGSTFTSDAALYDPNDDQWRPVGSANEPTPRIAAGHVWTGREVLVWGGGASGSSRQDGALFDPRTGAWRAVELATSPLGASYYGPGGAAWTGHSALFWGGWRDRESHAGGAAYDPEPIPGGAWSPIAIIGAPTPRNNTSIVFTGSRLLVWGGFSNVGAGCSHCGDGAAYDPQRNIWLPLSATGAPLGRFAASTAWTGRHLLIWGGDSGSNMLGDGALNDPRLDRWSPMETRGAPSPRSDVRGRWTGREFIVWGGTTNRSSGMSDGRRYYPPRPIRRWDALATENQPTPRTKAAAHWTGRELIVWGGYEDGTQVDGGAKWSADTERWTTTSTIGQPPPLRAFVSVWTGSKMLIWGGANAQGGLTNQGWAYDPSQDEWSAMSTVDAPAAREQHVGVWTGRELVVWGGAWSGADGSGGRYDPSTDTWLPTQLPGPNPRTKHKAVWTGREMVVFGGTRPEGHRYDPDLDNWRSVSTSTAPAQRFDHTMVWTGREVVVWGGTTSGQGTRADGGRYDPRNDTWTSIPADTRFARAKHTATWTGSHMVIWGGYDNLYRSSGGRYDPRTGEWTETLQAYAPSARVDHHALWTGRELMIWGGTSANVDGAKYVP